MTSKGKNPLDDEFEAFLAGEGELARELSALRQPESPQRLNDAIMAAAEARIAREQATRGTAANDVGPEVAPAPRPSFMTRWHVPAAMAASMIGAVLLMLEWQRGDYAPPDRSEIRAQAKAAPASSRVLVEASAPAPALAPAPEPELARERHTLPSEQPAALARAKPAAPAMAKAADTPPPPRPMQVEHIPTPFIAKEREESLAYAPPPPPPPAMPIQERTAVFARAAPRPMIALPAPAIAPSPSVVAAPISVAPSAPAPINDPKAAAWLNVIDEMLKADLRKDARDEWKKFRLAYPDYPVPEALAKHIATLD